MSQMINVRSIRLAIATVFAISMVGLLSLGHPQKAAAKPICLSLAPLANIQIALFEGLESCPGH